MALRGGQYDAPGNDAKWVAGKGRTSCGMA